MNRELASKIAFSYLGKPYIWGGDDPLGGFDCSGFVIEILRSVGILSRDGDWTAQGLWNLFTQHRVSKPAVGCLVFYRGASDERSRIVHVEYCLDEHHSIGASGGGSSTQQLTDAIVTNAFVKVRLITGRSNIAGYVDPFELGVTLS